MPKVFISYSHDTPEHMDRVLALSKRLRSEGVDCEIDQYQESPAEGWPKWMDRQILEADFVLVICTETYYRRVTGSEAPGKGLGVRWESTLTYQHLYDAGAENKKFIPVLFAPQDSQYICTPLRGATCYVLDQDYETLYRRLTHQPKHVKPELGTIKPLPPKERKSDFFAPQVSLAKLPTTHHALFGREKELRRLDEAWENPQCHIVCLVAFGGVGKTALVNEWLNRVSLDGWRGAQRVYGWSFYSQGTREDKQASADSFFDDALRFFGYTGEPPKSAWDKGVLLARLIRERRTLLILDGLEPLQYPPGIEEGRLRDQGVQALLKELARFNNGLCLITTRCKVTDIAATEGRTTHQLMLENLSPQAGRQLLREAGVCHGTDRELEQAAQEYDGHALALTLLGSYLATVHDGEIRKRDLIPQLTAEVEHGGHAKRVMESYEIWLKGTAELEILYLMGLFDRPAPLGAIHALIKGERIKGLTDKLHNISDQDWCYAVKHLRELRLLSASDADLLDCHPLIREHFADKLRRKAPGAWRLAHERLYEYYKNLPQKLYGKELPDTLEEMEPLFAAVAHGCQAGKHQEALDEIYFKKICRGNEHFSTSKLGAFGLDLSAISNFFETTWNKVFENITEADKAWVLSKTGFRLRALGRLREAAQPMQAGMENSIQQKDWKGAAQDAGNLSELYLTLGEVQEAVRFARQSVDFADRSGDEFEKYSKRTTLADALHQAGELAKAKDWFRQAEAMQQKRQPEYRYLYSQGGFRFCDLLLDQGQAQEVLKRARQTLEWAEQYLGLLPRALDKLSLGRAYMLEAVGNMTVTSQVTVMLQQAADYLNQAVAGLRKSGDQDVLPLALFARACYYRLQGQFPQAWEDLAEALEIAERGDMKLWLVDYHLEASRLLISEFGFRNLEEQSSVISRQSSVASGQSAVASNQLSVDSDQLSVDSDQLSVGEWQVIIDGRVVTLNREEMMGRLKFHVEQAAELVRKTGYHRRDPEVELGYAGLYLAQGDWGRARERLARGKKLLEKMGIRCWDFWVKQLSELSEVSG